MLRSVLVTGGTGSIGTALVKAFCALGHPVWFQYASDTATARELTLQTGAEAFQFDARSGSLVDLPDLAVDIIVNNAGVNVTSSLAADVTEQEWNLTLLVNLTLPFLVVKRYLPGMVARHWGRIINISSIYGLRAVEQNLPYTVSKHALRGMTRTLAREYAAVGVTCNEICPGPVDSRLMATIALREADGGPEEVQAYLSDVRKAVPAGRLAIPGEVAALALFVASDDAAYLNGASIPLDGGYIA